MWVIVGFQNSIEAQGSMYLAQAMRLNTRLQVLDLNNNRLGDRGAEHFANILRLATSLKSLCKWSSSSQPEGSNLFVPERFHSLGPRPGQESKPHQCTCSTKDSRGIHPKLR